MAKQIESGDERYKLQKLRPEVDDLCNDFDALVDSPLDERKELERIFEVLKKIRSKISPQQQVDGKQVDDEDEDKLLPRSKREELHNALPLIRAALEQRSKRRRGQQDAAETESSAGGADDSKPASATTGCIPCKPRASKQQQQQQQSKQEQEEREGVSLTLLLRLIQNVLEPEQFYEWTTSYVDEERIYGWDKEAGEVIDALVAPDGSERMFRAAGIAGIHGSGKTVLAQKVFVHDKAKDNFALRLWVCVGPPDSEDRFNLLYRMLDNLGLDTAKVEDIVDRSNVVKKAKDEEEKKIDKGELRKKAAEMVVARRPSAAPGGVAGQNQAAEAAKKETSDDASKIKEEGNAVTTAAGDDANTNRQAKEEEARIFEELLKEKVDNSRAVETSKIGVLLYILNMTLSKTSYMIVFDDIRAYRHDDDKVYTDGCWYENLTLPPPPETDKEWRDRLAYGLPKGEHRGAVLVTCRKEDDAKTMSRTGLVVCPPKLEGDDAWKLFRREYKDKRSEQSGKTDDDRLRDRDREESEKKKDDDEPLLKQLEEMKEKIVIKCLGLPVAIIEAARGFAALDPLTNLSPPSMKEAADEAKPAAAGAGAGGHTEAESSKAMGMQMPEPAAGAGDADKEPDED